jgi:pyruvate dehydrogenase complex dehydrogenase (E1) component
MHSPQLTMSARTRSFIASYVAGAIHRAWGTDGFGCESDTRAALRGFLSRSPVRYVGVAALHALSRDGKVDR